MMYIPLSVCIVHKRSLVPLKISFPTNDILNAFYPTIKFEKYKNISKKLISNLYGIQAILSCPITNYIMDKSDK